MPCESCQSPRSHVALFEYEKSDRSPNAVDRLVTLQDLQATSAAGCRRCFLILEAAQKRVSSGDHPVPCFEMPEQYVIGINDTGQCSENRKYRYGHGSVLDILLCERSCWIKEIYGAVVTFGLYTESVETSDALLIPFASRVPAKMSVESCSVRIKLWLERCIDTHPGTCRRTTSTLPKRVIDVGSDKRRLRIHATEAGEQGTYCALSYCWGESVPFLTETSNYERLKAGFDLEVLPKTIRDAVLLVRGLGIRYLWVDSLCIIQDSVQDWECEAALMGDVYSRAVFVIAVVDAPDSDTGMFHEDERRHFHKVGADHESVFVRQDFHNGVTDSRIGQPIKQLTQDALHGRGWTLQEVALASRTVWFKSGEISWSCVSSTACECRPELLDNVYSVERDRHLLQNIAYLQSSGANRSQWLEMWHRLVEDYCGRRSFSNIQDRLPAIAGLASKMQSHIDCRYLFGFWDNESLLQNLLWFCEWHDNPTDPDQFPPHDYAPTWSWASCSASVRVCWDCMETFCGVIWKLEAVNIALSTSNPFGPGRGALHLHSLVVPVTQDPVGKHGFCYIGSMKNTIASRLKSEIASRVLFVLNKPFGYYHEDHRIDYEDTSHWYQSRQLLFIFSTIWPNYTTPTYFEGLLLERLQETEEGLHRYRRLGRIASQFSKPSEVEDGTSWKLLEPDSDSEPEGTDSEFEDTSSRLDETTTNSIRAETDSNPELKQIDPDSESEELTTELELRNLDTDSGPNGLIKPETVYAQPTWEYWQKLGKWETIVLV